MNKNLLFIAISCFVVFMSCSTQEDFGGFTSKPVSVTNPNETDTSDTNGKPGIIDVPDKVNDSIDNSNVVVAHRGAWKKKNLPQNSIASLKEAIRLKCKGSEFDIWLTADDSLLVCHDITYNNLKIQDSKFSDLISLKLPNGEKLSTLREYIIAGKQNNTTTLLFCELKNNWLNIARKKIFLEKTLECVKKLNAQQLMVFTSFDYTLLKQMRALDSLVDIRYINGDVPPEQLKIDKITGTAYYIDAFKNHINWIESAKINNIILGAGDANDRTTLKWCFDNNIDAITTDEPELALSYLATLKN